MKKKTDEPTLALVRANKELISMQGGFYVLTWPVNEKTDHIIAVYPTTEHKPESNSPLLALINAQREISQPFFTQELQIAYMKDNPLLRTKVNYEG